MAKSNNTNQAILSNTEDQLSILENAVILMAQAGMHGLIDQAIVKAGYAYTEAEHAAAKPQTAAEKAAAALKAAGVDLASLTPAKAQAGTLALTLDGIAKACGKYGKHCFGADVTNGTSLVTYSITKQLIETGKATLAKTLDDARQHLPSYSSTGHFNTMKRLLKEHYNLNVWQGGFAISAKK